jgi:hypothetical protein
VSLEVHLSPDFKSSLGDMRSPKKEREREREKKKTRERKERREGKR